MVATTSWWYRERPVGSGPCGSCSVSKLAIFHIVYLFLSFPHSFLLFLLHISLYAHFWHYLQSSHLPPSLCVVSSLCASLNQILNIVFSLTTPQVSAFYVWFWIHPSPVWSCLSQNFPFHIFLYVSSMLLMSLLSCTLIPALLCV